MSQKRSLTSIFFVASLGLAAGFAAFSAPVSAADCSPAVKKEAVKKHCKGGQSEVKKTMKDAMDDANKGGATGPDGKKLECKTCHKDATKFELNDGAEALYDKYLAPHIK
jgi:hypothetical protein